MNICAQILVFLGIVQGTTSFLHNEAMRTKISSKFQSKGHRRIRSEKNYFSDLIRRCPLRAVACENWFAKRILL